MAPSSHDARAFLLSDRKTIHDLRQRSKVNTGILKTVTLAVSFYIADIPSPMEPAESTSLRPWQVQQKETLLMTHRAVERSIVIYPVPVLRSTKLHDDNYRNIECIQNEALRIAIGGYKVFNIDHLHIEAEKEH